MPKFKLSAKQKLFAELCAKGETQPKAYALAGYKVDGSSDETISRMASRCMANAQVKAYYESLMESSTKKAIEELSYTQQDWLKTQFKILRLALGDDKINKIASFNGEVFEHKVKETDLGAALRAQEQLGKMLALFVDKQELSGNMTIKNLIQELSSSAANGENDSPLPRDDEC